MAALRIIHATTPIRICDNGGWTDTWVARRGKVFNIAVTPRVSVKVEVYARGSREGPVVINAEKYGTRYAPSLGEAAWGAHPLLEGCLCLVPPPDDTDIEITIGPDAPAGASTGTSASVAVALLGALHRLVGNRRTPYEVAYDAHAVETTILGGESGVQDQLCAASGGINFIDIVDFPRAAVSPLAVSPEWRAELQSRLSLISYGQPHNSSEVHRLVLRDLGSIGPDEPRLEALRHAAVNARDAVLAGDIHALGRALQHNTELQAALHPALVSSDARRIIEIARQHGAIGWKVNGAGGDGGSIALLSSDDANRQAGMIGTIVKEMPHCQRIAIALSDEGLTVWSDET
jgi:D-glycero-alpha-D-manno-heptose-7-phosphate kinase